jgi:hypothetical protein
MWTVHREGSALSAASAVPAAVRLPRSAAVRRAVLTLLFLGGFLALACVFGGSAHAASGTDDGRRESTGEATGLLKSDNASDNASDNKAPGKAGKANKAGKVADADADADAADKAKAKPKHTLTRAEPVEQQRREAPQTTGNTASHVVGPVAGSVDLDEEITRPVGETAGDVTGSQDLHELSGRLGLGELGDGIAREGSGGGSGHADGGTDGLSDAGTGDAWAGADGPQAHGCWGAASAASLLGTAVHATADDGSADGGGDPAERPPFHHTPDAPAPSTSQHAGDSQGQRGGPHQYAVFITGTELFGPLQPGAARAADGRPTRDRAGDVLEFPG